MDHGGKEFKLFGENNNNPHTAKTDAELDLSIKATRHTRYEEERTAPGGAGRGGAAGARGARGAGVPGSPHSAPLSLGVDSAREFDAILSRA